MKIVATAGKLSYRERDAGGYEAAADWWCEWEGGPEIYAVLADGTAQVFGRRITIRKGFSCDGASGAVDFPEHMEGFFAHDAWYRLHRQRMNGRRRIGLALRWVGDLLMHLLNLRSGMLWLRAQYIYRMCRWFGRDRASRVDKESIVITVPA